MIFRRGLSVSDIRLVVDALEGAFSPPREYFQAWFDDPEYRDWQLLSIWDGNMPVSIVKVHMRGPIAGFAGVVTSKPHRGRGLSSYLVRRALHTVDARGYGVVMLFTRIPGFYEKFGFENTHRAGMMIKKIDPNMSTDMCYKLGEF